MRKIHSFEKFKHLYESEVVGPGETEKSKLYDQTLGMILTGILNAYTSLTSYPLDSYENKIKPDLESVKSSPIENKVKTFLDIMTKVKKESSDNKVEGAQESIDAWIAVGSKVGEALTAMINQYKDQPEEQKYINDFINSSIENYLLDFQQSTKENTLIKKVAKKTNESYEFEEGAVFEKFLQGKKGMIEDVSKQITIVLAKLAALENIPGMADEVATLRAEVNKIAAEMGSLLDKPNREIEKDAIRKASARLSEIPTLLDKSSQIMLKQDTANKEAASILIQALALVKVAKEKEIKYLENKKEEEEKETISFDKKKIGTVQPTVLKFQKLVVDKFKNNKQISSLNIYKRMGTDGKYGPGTRAMVEIMKTGFGLSDTSGDTITKELIRELEKQEPLKESRIYTFSQYSGFLNEGFDAAKAAKKAQELENKFVQTTKQKTPGSSPGASASNPNFTPYKEGAKGIEIIAIQNSVGAGLNSDDPEKNGIFGPKTKNAVIKFQKDNGLKMTGEVNWETIQKMKTSKFGGDWTQNMISRMADFKTIKQGSKGPKVSAIQVALEADVTGKEEDDQFFGPKTKEAVIKYQKANKNFLKPTGEIDWPTAQFMARDKFLRGPKWASDAISEIAIMGKINKSATLGDKKLTFSNELIEAANKIISGTGLQTSRDRSPREIFTGIKKIKSPEDLKRINQILSASKFSKDNILASTPLEEVKKLGIIPGSKYKDLKDLINGVMEYEDLSIVQGIVDHLKSKGIDCSFKEDNGEFVRGSFKTPDALK